LRVTKRIQQPMRTAGESRQPRLAKGPGWQENFASRKPRRAQMSHRGPAPPVKMAPFVAPAFDNRNIFAELMLEDDSECEVESATLLAGSSVSHLDIEEMLLSLAERPQTVQADKEDSASSDTATTLSEISTDVSSVISEVSSEGTAAEQTLAYEDLSCATAAEPTVEAAIVGAAEYIVEAAEPTVEAAAIVEASEPIVEATAPVVSHQASPARSHKKSLKRVTWRDQDSNLELEQVKSIENCLNKWVWADMTDLHTFEGKVCFSAGALWYGMLVMTAWVTLSS